MLEQNFAGDWDIFVATATSFLETVDENLADLVSAFAAGDVDRTMRAAHRLKGETSLFHIADIPADLKTIETEARGGVLPTAAAVDTAKSHIQRLCAEIRIILAQ